MTIAIRAASPSDIDAVLDFWKIATAQPTSTDDVDAVRVLLSFAPEPLLLAHDGSELVGTVIVGWDGWRASMYRLAVAPSHRRAGIASMLVAAGERSLCAMGARRFHMVVAGDEPVAQSFWTSRGYAPTDQLRFVKTID